ncbi:RAB6A-GEF complex partner protein 2-like [Penaeus japonicus]|uniref:RAB6A-GEF complex partner protein 2-like n=1 Tax=Penaeus japonicus TaxID=27405 RepID=UPI001C713ADD|nr:RAB6A-GEF complex partner protein 2-like [Penaeus japonicus]XP_042889923.1 RAB6A-GEF complex partner protein 2-like [Penaeus japonicus]
MVEVQAQVLGGPVHLAGDTVQVCITITVPSLDPALRAQSSDVCEVLAWGSAQIHCQCSVNESRVRLAAASPKQAEERAVTNADTSFAPCRGERGHVVLSTKPKILFCDLQLLPGESRSFVYRETLPCDAPPTYRGQLLKYAYKITIGVQRLGSPIKLLRVPIRVIVLQGLSEACVYSESGELAPSNPFLHTPQRDTPRHTALQIIQNLSTRKNVNQYNITNTQGKVVRFCIYKTSFRLGEDIVATFDFSNAEVPCVQYSVTLQSEEVISEACRQRPSQKPMLVPYSKAHEVCLNMTHTNLLLPIPLHVTPTFTSDLVSLQWRLHFEFVTSKTEVPGPSTPQNPEDQIEWRAPSSLEIETMVWDLPITVLPTTPSQVAQAICMPAQQTLKL